MNTKLNKKLKMTLTKILSSRLIIQFSVKPCKMGEKIDTYNVSKEEAMETRRNYLVSGSKAFHKKQLLTIEMRKTESFINNPVNLCLLKLDLSKPVIYENTTMFELSVITQENSDRID